MASQSIQGKKGWRRVRMCVDFMDLNINCPKDCYPSPSIEQKVAAAAGYEVLSFLNLYKGYHQVLLDLADAAKTAFIIDRGVFAYKKNAF